MSSKHRILKKNFETEMIIDGGKLPLNHFVQETIANMMIGFSRALKGSPEDPETIEIKIKRLPGRTDVDAHTYP